VLVLFNLLYETHGTSSQLGESVSLKSQGSQAGSPTRPQRRFFETAYDDRYRGSSAIGARIVHPFRIVQFCRTMLQAAHVSNQRARTARFCPILLRRWALLLSCRLAGKPASPLH
jgi:hypothetical protein